MDSGNVLIIEASAGSGKTYRLTLEFLIRLLNLTHRFLKKGGVELNSEIANILAITFTNKAANEMKERIIEQLKAFALMDGKDLSPMFQAVADETELSREEITGYSELILDAIISHLGDFNVKTIDSLMASIIKVVSPDLNLVPGFEVSIDATRELGRLSGEYLDYCADYRWNEIEDVLKMLRELGQLNNWRPDEKIADKLKEFFHQYMKSEEEHLFGGNSSEEFRKVRQEKLNSLSVLLPQMGEIIKKDRESKKKFLDGNKVRATLINEFLSFAEMQESKKADYLTDKSFFCKSSGVELMSKKAAAEGSFTSEQDNFLALYEKIKTDVEALILALSRERVSGYSVLFDGFREFWNSKRRNIYVEEFSKTLKDKIEQWSSEGCFPYIFLKLSERYRHFMFDEFQDTSRLQFRALSPVIEEVLTGEEDSSLFIVGDRKQAIYRWRGGSAELMNESVLNGEFMDSVDPGNFSKEVLEYNWRSRNTIVNFNNEFWETGFSDEIAQNFSTVFQKTPDKGGSNSGGYVELRFAESDDSKSGQEILCEEVFSMVELAVSRGYSYGDIAVLTRKKSRGREIIQYLSSKGVKAISDESLFLSSSQIVNEIIVFLRFLELPSSDLLFSEFLNGVMLDSVLTVKERTDLNEFLLKLNLRDRKKSSIFSMFTESFPLLRERFIDPFLNSTGLIPVYDLFNDIGRIYGIYENHVNETPFILTFSEYLHNLEADGISSVSSFLTEWDSSDSSGPVTSVDVTVDSESVRIMTLHKSKGLEFPVVILPLADEKERADNVFMREGKLYYISKKYAELNSELYRIYKEENLKKYIDELNLLYVGFTRAVDMLLVPVLKSEKKKKSESEDIRFRGFADIIVSHPLTQQSEGDSLVFGVLPEHRVLEVPGDKETLVIPPKYKGTAGWQKKMLVYAASKYEAVDSRESALRGEAVHEMMEGIESYQDREQLIEALNTRFRHYSLSEKEKRKYTEFFTSPEVIGFYTGDWQVYNEFDIAGSGEQGLSVKRIDRLMRRQGELVIIDYKTGSKHKDEYEAQIKEYGRLASEATGVENVSLYLLYPDNSLIKQIKP